MEGLQLTWRALFAQVRRWWKLWLLLAVLCGVGVLVSQHAQLSGDGEAVARINFSYDGIEQGLDPSGNRFNVGELKDEAIIARAGERLGMSLSGEAVARVRENIAILGSVPAGTISTITSPSSVYGDDDVASTTGIQRSSYYPTNYTVKLDYRGAGLSKSEGIRLLDGVLEAYGEYFNETYGYNPSVERSVRAVDYNDYDYFRAVEVLDLSLGSLQDYVGQLAQRDNSRFVSTETGYSFADLADAIATVRREDIGWVSSFIEKNSVTKSRSQIMEYYNMKIEDSLLDEQEVTSRLETLNVLIDEYEKTSAVVAAALVLEGADSTTVYQVNQPSDAFDNLLRERVECRTELSRIQEDLSLYRTRLSRARMASVKSENTQTVEASLAAINEKVEQLLSDTNRTAGEYFDTVALRQAYQVLSAAGAAITPGMVVSSAIRPALMVELLLFGLFLLLCVIFALAGWSGPKKRAAAPPAAQPAPKPDKNRGERKRGRDRKKPAGKAAD